MDKSFYGHKRQTNIASLREGLIAPVTFSLFFSLRADSFQHHPVPVSLSRVPFQRPAKAYKEAAKTSKAFT